MFVVWLSLFPVLPKPCVSLYMLVRLPIPVPSFPVASYRKGWVSGVHPVPQVVWMSENSTLSGSLMPHMGLFVPTIIGQGSPEQVGWWLFKALTFEIVGGYAQVPRVLCTHTHTHARARARTRTHTYTHTPSPIPTAATLVADLSAFERLPLL